MVAVGGMLIKEEVSQIQLVLNGVTTNSLNLQEPQKRPHAYVYNSSSHRAVPKMLL